MRDVFEDWCGDPRDLTFGEFVDELFGEWEDSCRRIGLGFLDERRYRQWRDLAPVSPTDLEWADVYAECRRRVGNGEHFAVCFVDVDHYQQYCDRNGNQSAAKVMAVLTRILRKVTKSRCAADGFVTPIGGDRFVLVLPVEDVRDVLAEVCTVFDNQVALQGDGRESSAKHRSLQTRVPVMKLSIGVVTNEERRFAHFAQIAELGVEMINYARMQPTSVFVVDRRDDLADS